MTLEIWKKKVNGKTLNLTLWKLDISKAKRQQNEQVSLYESHIAPWS